MTGRALLRRAIGFSVGFATALTIIVATEAGRRSTTPVIEVVGAPDVFDYCRSGEFVLEAALRSDDADGWRCVGRRNQIWGFDPVDFDDVCRTQFGEAAWALTEDPSSPYEWRCVVER